MWEEIGTVLVYTLGGLLLALAMVKILLRSGNSRR